MSPSEYQALERALHQQRPLIWAHLPADADIIERVRAMVAGQGKDARIWTVAGQVGEEGADHAGTLAEAVRFLMAEAPPVLILRDLPSPPFDAGLERSLEALARAAARHGCQVIVLGGRLPPPPGLSPWVFADEDDGAGAASPMAMPALGGTTIPVRQVPPPFPVVTVWLAVALALPVLAVFWIGGFRWDAFQNDSVLVFLGAKVKELIDTGDYWRLVTSAFLSASLIHFLINLLTLAVVGSVAEACYGRARLLTIFLLAGTAGAAASYRFNPMLSVLGSAPLLGVMGALAVHQWKYRAYQAPRIAARLRWLGPLLLAQGLVAATHAQVVDVFGLMGGGAAGALLGYLLEGRVMGDERAAREALPLPAASLPALALAVVGLAGLTVNFGVQGPLLQGAVAQTRQEYGYAVEQYRLAAARQPQLVEVRLQLARLLVITGELDEAWTLLDSYLKARYTDAKARLQFAQLLWRKGQLREATQQLEEYLRLRPNDQDAVLALGSWLIRTGRWPEARRRLQDLVADHQDDDRVRQLVAELLVVDMAGTLEREGHPEQAIEAWRDALALVRDPRQRALVENNLAYTLANSLNDHLDEALALVESALKREPGNPAYLDTLAWVYYRQQRFAEALPIQLRAIARMAGFRGEAGEAEMYYHLGAIREALGRREEARADYQRALTADPAFRPAREGLRRLGGTPPIVVPSPPTPGSPPGITPGVPGNAPGPGTV
ncbi:MAG: tetratricopeptide repeat protein [Armatimonadetes bacterium]|nr:tetratricopeptide repeat protein [Armatimonadota bacterium]